MSEGFIMYSMDRTQKFKIIFYVLSLISFVVSVIDFLNRDSQTIAFIFLGLFLLLLLLGVTLNAIQKDLSENFKHLNAKVDDSKK